jgi:hypothetical protein
VQKKVSLRKISEQYFGIGYRRYQQLADEGIVPKPERGKVDFFEATKALMAYYRKLAEGDGESSLAEERRKKVATERKIKEIELDKMRGNLMPVWEAIDRDKRFVAIINSHLLGLGRGWAGLLAPMNDPKDIEDFIKKEIQKILKELHDAYKKRRG